MIILIEGRPEIEGRCSQIKKLFAIILVILLGILFKTFLSLFLSLLKLRKLVSDDEYDETESDDEVEIFTDGDE